MTPQSPAPARDPAQVKKEAITWYAHLCSGDATERDLREHQRWCGAHPDNANAWARFEAMRQSFAQVPMQVAASTLQIASRNRRRSLKYAMLLASSGAAAYAGYALSRQDQLLPASWLADFSTRVGERRRVTLADGSLLILNTDTAVDVSFDARQRLIRLLAGELLVDTAAHRLGTEDARPLAVQTSDGRAMALGTRFTVRRFDDRTEVAVLASAVEVTPLHAAQQRRVLTAGQRMAFSASQAFAVRRDEGVADWVDGSLVVNDWPLREVLAELARYRRGYLGCDPEVADIRVSGAFPLDDNARALALLVRSFPIRVSFLTRYWARVGAA